MPPRFKNRSTAVHETLTSEFRSGLKGIGKSKVPAFGVESSRINVGQNSTLQWFKDRGIPMDSLKRI